MAIYRLWLVSFLVLVLTAVLCACGESKRNCSQSFMDGYNKVHNYVLAYSHAPSKEEDFNFVKTEAQSTCEEFEKEFSDTECMAEKRGKFTKVTGKDYHSNCEKVRAGTRIPRQP